MIANKARAVVPFHSICALYERFLGSLTCETALTGEALAKNILTQPISWHLCPDLLCGQRYDGARAMSRKVKGDAARIHFEYPKALFVHCVSHRLNLCIIKSCSGREKSNMNKLYCQILQLFTETAGFPG